LLLSFLLQMPFSTYRSVFINDLDAVFHDGAIWRSLTSKLAFLETSDLVLGCLLIYYFRIFERRYGARKYMSAILLFAVGTTVLELTLAVLLRLLSFELHYLPSGPFFLIYPFFPACYFDIPRIPLASIFGIPLTGKTFLYLFGFQLVGLAYNYNLYGLQKRVFVPKRTVEAVSNGLGPWLRSTPPATLERPLGATLELQYQEELDRQEQRWMETRRVSMNAAGVGDGWPFGGFRRRIPVYSPSEEEVRTLVEMGFRPDISRRALQQARGDVSEAVAVIQGLMH
uniref:UBA domain-containing protein n=1 Tax=Schistocephalus solidus TaxID=70667 RepID=A0A183SLY3_SCHSO